MIRRIISTMLACGVAWLGIGILIRFEEPGIVRMKGFMAVLLLVLAFVARPHCKTVQVSAWFRVPLLLVSAIGAVAIFLLRNADASRMGAGIIALAAATWILQLNLRPDADMPRNTTWEGLFVFFFGVGLIVFLRQWHAGVLFCLIALVIWMVQWCSPDAPPPPIQPPPQDDGAREPQRGYTIKI